MTDDTPFVTFEPSAWLEKHRQYQALCESVRPVNKLAVFDALAKASITSVRIDFDGCGDSGQIESISACAGSDVVEFPPDEITVIIVDEGDLSTTERRLSLNDAIETLAYDFLEQTHGGWENNEGAWGEFCFDVSDRTITLDFNERIETSEYTQHVF